MIIANFSIDKSRSIEYKPLTLAELGEATSRRPAASHQSIEQ
jgi:hypothetical protein